jgi:hypothetical protein
MARVPFAASVMGTALAARPVPAAESRPLLAAPGGHFRLTVSERLHQVAPRFAKHGGTVGGHRRRTAQDRATNPRSGTTNHD